MGWEGAFSSPRFERMTYLEADLAANQVAHALLAAGRQPGDRILLYCDNSVEAVVAMVGIAKAGMVVVPVNSLLAPDVLAWAVEHVGASYVIADAALAPRGAEVFAAADLEPDVVIEIGGTASGGAAAFDRWIDEMPTHEVDVRIHSDDIWALLFTSGTTSMPKASMTAHSYSYLSGYTYAMSFSRGLSYETDLVVGTFLPIVYHCGHNATVVPAALSGGTCVIGRRPDDVALAEAITRERITTVWAGSPLWVRKLVEVAEERPADIDLTSVTVALFSWGAITPDLFPRLRAVAGGDVQPVEVFGQTESQCCFRFWPDAHPDRATESYRGVNHVGLPVPLLAADIHAPDGRSLAGTVGEAGEAVYRSPVITQGYYRNPEATAEAFRDGWFHSGDSCAYVGGPDRSQVMLDRLKDVVKTGGENVSSVRVEGVIAAHPSVEKVAVIGLPDDAWGELVTAVVLPVPGAEVVESELIGWAANASRDSRRRSGSLWSMRCRKLLVARSASMSFARSSGELKSAAPDPHRPGQGEFPGELVGRVDQLVELGGDVVRKRGRTARVHSDADEHDLDSARQALVGPVEDEGQHVASLGGTLDDDRVRRVLPAQVHLGEVADVVLCREHAQPAHRTVVVVDADPSADHVGAHRTGIQVVADVHVTVRVDEVRRHLALENAGQRENLVVRRKGRGAHVGNLGRGSSTGESAGRDHCGPRQWGLVAALTGDVTIGDVGAPRSKDEKECR
nr:AMP-binding protein [Nocardioides sambongensis]